MVRADCELMCNNCLKYNTEDTPFHGLALKMLKETERIIQVKRSRFIKLILIIKMSLRTCESDQKMKFIKLMNFIKRAIKFLKRDNLDIQKINDVLEIDRQNERSSSDESDSNSANDSSANSPRFDTHFFVYDIQTFIILQIM